MSNAAKFCHECGKALKIRYIANDPENGPAHLRCPDGHETIEESLYVRDVDRDFQRQEDYLVEITHGGCDPNDPTPDGVRLAAKVILAYRENQDLKHEAEMLRCERLSCEGEPVDETPEDETDRMIDCGSVGDALASLDAAMRPR